MFDFQIPMISIDFLYFLRNFLDFLHPWSRVLLFPQRPRPGAPGPWPCVAFRGNSRRRTRTKPLPGCRSAGVPRKEEDPPKKQTYNEIIYIYIHTLCICKCSVLNVHIWINLYIYMCVYLHMCRLTSTCIDTMDVHR